MNKHGGNIKEASKRFNIDESRIIDFSANINPLGISPAIKKAIKEAIPRLVNYPDPGCSELKKCLADYYGIQENNILPGNGSSELIYLVSDVLGPKKALIVQPNFSEYEESLKKNRCAIKNIIGKEKNDFKVNIEDIINSIKGNDILYLSSPNNPSGYIYSREELTELLAQCKKKKVYLFADEVFLDFVKEKDNITLIKKVKSEKYLIVLKSLTKFFALPGLRLGSISANKELIGKLNSKITPWSVNSLAQSAGIAAVKDKLFAQKTIDYTYNEREYLLEHLIKIPDLKIFPSNANYILCRTDADISLKSMEEILGKNKILIRNCSNYTGLNDKYFRIAVKKRNENKLLLKIISNFFKKS